MKRPNNIVIYSINLTRKKSRKHHMATVYKYDAHRHSRSIMLKYNSFIAFLY